MEPIVALCVNLETSVGCGRRPDVLPVQLVERASFSHLMDLDAFDTPPFDMDAEAPVKAGVNQTWTGAQDHCA
jgi:hypothetical protein